MSTPTIALISSAEHLRFPQAVLIVAGGGAAGASLPVATIMTLIRDYAFPFLPIAGGIRRSKFLQVFAASNFIAKR